MFHPPRPQRKRTAIPHRGRPRELRTHFNLVLSSLSPLRRGHTLPKSSFLSAPVNLESWAALEEMQILYELRQKKTKREKSLQQREQHFFFFISIHLFFGGGGAGTGGGGRLVVGAVLGTAETRLNRVAAMTAGLSAHPLTVN